MAERCAEDEGTGIRRSTRVFPPSTLVDNGTDAVSVAVGDSDTDKPDSDQVKVSPEYRLLSREGGAVLRAAWGYLQGLPYDWQRAHGWAPEHLVLSALQELHALVVRRLLNPACVRPSVPDEPSYPPPPTMSGKAQARRRRWHGPQPLPDVFRSHLTCRHVVHG